MIVRRRWTEVGDQHHRRLAADPIDGDRAAIHTTGGMAARERIGGKRLRAEGRERGGAAKMCLRVVGRTQKLAVGRERRHRRVAAGEQPVDALSHRQVGTDALGGDDENCGGVVGQRDLRAGAGEGTPNSLAESAQLFQSREAPPDNVSANRAICAAVGWSASNVLALIAADVGAPKMAAPIGLAHRMRVASVLQSQAGSALVASGASLWSRRKDS